ncbi:MAG: TadE/TadG family type IV pilus assembly protein [Anaerolineae bacterium]|nr:TadE/TadG family type IV pilus assembly protein [Anaerolineae bacterium]
MRPLVRNGQSTAELALLLPLLMLIFVGCLDVGRAFSAWVAVNNGSREGARFACLSPNDVEGIETRTKDDIVAEGLDADRTTVGVSMPLGCASGNSIGVTAEYSLPLLTSYVFGGNPVKIRATTWMVIIGGCA